MTVGAVSHDIYHVQNNDFPDSMKAIFTLAPVLEPWMVEAACLFDTSSTTNFKHNHIIGGFPNGAIGYGQWDSKWGACSNLVHHAYWVGWGETT